MAEEEENPFAEDKKEEEKTTPLKGEDLGQEKGNYKGFDKYAKFVEFEEKMFKVEEVADEELMQLRDKTLRSAKSIVVRDGEQLDLEDKRSNHSSPREYD